MKKQFPENWIPLESFASKREIKEHAIWMRRKSDKNKFGDPDRSARKKNGRWEVDENNYYLEKAPEYLIKDAKDALFNMLEHFDTISAICYYIAGKANNEYYRWYRYLTGDMEGRLKTVEFVDIYEKFNEERK